MKKINFISFFLFSFVAQAQEVQVDKPIPIQKIEFEERVINVVRAGEKDPTTETTLEETKIKKEYAGQEMSSVISDTPSVTWYSDNGAYNGYSYIRLRGIDQTRINFTLNGVPLNDAEDQVVYLSNFPDFLNSIQSIQIQRGVGTSTNGTGAFGGSINMESPSLQDPGYVDISTAYGSYNTFKLSPEFNTGLINNKWSFYGRYSVAHSDGFRDHSSTDGDSFFFSGGYFSEKNIVKLTAFTGHSKVHLSYLAVPESTLQNNYQFNPLTEDEKDDFQQTVTMLQHTLLLNPNTFLTSTAYYGYAQGAYNVFFAPDLYSFNLETHFYGGIVNVQYENEGFKINTGVHANDYVRYHSSYIQPFQSTQLYKNAGNKTEFAAFVKMSQQLGKFGIFGDIQYRMPRFSYEQDDSTNLAFTPITWHFINPKGGVTYSITPQTIVYGSVGKTSREPTRNDMFAGFDNIDGTNYAQIGDFSKVKPESVIDYELGVKLLHSHWNVHFNFYDMEFTNEIAAIGQLSYIGLPLRKNVDSSYRRGIELFANIIPMDRMLLTTEANFSKNKIKEYTTDFDSQTYTNVDPLLTPSIQLMQAIEYGFTSWFKAKADTSYIGESFLDNTNNSNFTVPSSLIFNGSLHFYPWKGSKVSFIVNNIGNTKFYTSGYVQSGESYYFPMATRNYFVALEQRFE